MEQKKIENGNKLIAEFMGGVFSKGFHKWLKIDANPFKVIKNHNLHYHLSWDWLMPVVEKIDKIGKSHKKSTGVNACKITDPIDKVWLAVVEFIKWLNQNK